MSASAPSTTYASPCLAQASHLIWEESRRMWVLRRPEGALHLNRSAGEILHRCDGTRNLEAIVRELETLFDARDIARQVCDFIDLARERGWVV